MNAEIIAESVGIRFDLDRQKRSVSPAMTHVRRHCSTSWPLRDVSFTLHGGQGVALLGPNGSGKTTLMRAIAGVLTPDEGRIVVRGRIGSLLSTDAGLMPSLTGRENSVLLGVLAGMTRAQVREALPWIGRHSGLDEAFERPVATYSQGMRARLGFTVVELADPEVLLLDEVHEAIDESFRRTLEARVKRVRERGGIVVAAGHDRAGLSRLCDRALLLDRSGVRAVEGLGHVRDRFAAREARV